MKRISQLLACMVFGAALSLTVSAAGPDCGLADPTLKKQYGIRSQQLLNLAMAQGQNRSSVERMGPLEADWYGQLADAIDEWVLTGRDAHAFIPKTELAAHFRQISRLLAEALSADTPAAWLALKNYYTSARHGKAGAALGYFLSYGQCPA